jgi:predicted acylesterase/phospholipase RssA
MERLCKVIAVLGLTLLISACATASRTPYPFSLNDNTQPPGFSDVRLSPQDPGLPARLITSLRAEVAENPGQPLSILTLSGGGADGAFGAGVLLGWTQRGDRPPFSVVTGVSTGALIAPFAFLGPDYDGRLREAYTSGLATRLLKRKGLSALFSPGLFSSERLVGLVAHFVDNDLIDAIAAEQGKGRRLVVATTDLDTQTGVIWDIGAIAAQGVEQSKREGTEAGRLKARDLIRRILVASASVPGAFAPVMINTQSQGGDGSALRSEMHVDGSVTMPFFVLPESMVNWQIPADLRRKGHIYVLINGNISPHFEITNPGPVDIPARSLDTLTRSQARLTLLMMEGFAARNQLGMSVAAIPDGYKSGGLMAFDKPSMQKLFNLGFGLGQSGKAFQAPKP